LFVCFIHWLFVCLFVCFFLSFIFFFAVHSIYFLLLIGTKDWSYFTITFILIEKDRSWEKLLFLSNEFELQFLFLGYFSLQTYCNKYLTKYQTHGEVFKANLPNLNLNLNLT
jgi:hypothetical protein